jgi:hypothetical protein
MKTSQWVGNVLPLVLVGLIGLVVWQSAERQVQPPLVLACPDLLKGCTATLAGRDIQLGVDATIKPLKPFAIWVKAPGAGKVEARFTMEGMDMGFNLYTLRQDGNGVFRVTATLPICVTGRRDWILTLDIDGMGVAVPFVTEL